MLQAKKSNRKRSLKIKNVREKAWSLEIQREKELEILCKEIKIKKRWTQKRLFMTQTATEMREFKCNGFQESKILKYSKNWYERENRVKI